MAIKHIFLKFGRAILHVFLKLTITHQTTAAKNSKTANHASCAHSLSFHSGFYLKNYSFSLGFLLFKRSESRAISVLCASRSASGNSGIFRTRNQYHVDRAKLPIDTINSSSAISSFLNLKNTGSEISTKTRERSSSLYGLSPQNSPTIMQIKGRNPSQYTVILHRPSKNLSIKTVIFIFLLDIVKGAAPLPFAACTSAAECPPRSEQWLELKQGTMPHSKRNCKHPVSAVHQTISA